jgi:hypothetical protein
MALAAVWFSCRARAQSVRTVLVLVIAVLCWRREPDNTMSKWIDNPLLKVPQSPRDEHEHGILLETP